MPYGKYPRARARMRSYLKNVGRTGRKLTWAKKAGLKYSKGSKSVINSSGMPYGRTKMVNQHIDGTLLASRAFMPPSLVTKMRYVERFTLNNENTTGITGSEIAFRLGSLFDFNFTGTGHQPWGFDQLTPLYQQYQVYALKISVRVHHVTGVDPFLAINLRPNSSGYNLQNKFMYEIAERSSNTVMLFEQSNSDQSAATGRSVDKTWESGLIYLADIEGLSRLEYSNDVTYKGLAGGNPTKTPIMSIACGSAEPVPSCTVKCHVQVEFYVKWTSPNTPAES